MGSGRRAGHNAPAPPPGWGRGRAVGRLEPRQKICVNNTIAETRDEPNQSSCVDS